MFTRYTREPHIHGKNAQPPGVAILGLRFRRVNTARLPTVVTARPTPRPFPTLTPRAGGKRHAFRRWVYLLQMMVFERPSEYRPACASGHILTKRSNCNRQVRKVKSCVEVFAEQVRGAGCVHVVGKSCSQNESSGVGPC